MVIEFVYCLIILIIFILVIEYSKKKSQYLHSHLAGDFVKYQEEEFRIVLKNTL
jgi:uncharacterized membrane protein YcaP (DUF421 family)